MRRWLVSDLDGTLVDRSQRIAERDAAAVAEFRAAGGAVLLATGRTERSALPYHRMLDLDTPLIVYNGARIVGPDGAVLYARDLGAAWPALRDRLLPCYRPVSVRSASPPAPRTPCGPARVSPAMPGRTESRWSRRRRDRRSPS
ncbi:HAD hydrolase family protein [Actinocatenispora sera]|uniref:HAD family hydrolase n=1 Tax=Actinocatenispora sera TaxID=390989 RepID=UPI0033F7BA21